MRGRRWVVVAAVAVVCAWGLRDARRLHAAVGVRPHRPSAPAPLTRQDRVLVVAPHCDDETLACGGLLQRAVRAGARVQVVLITNGDGFRAAAEKLTGDAAPTPKDFLRLAEERQHETYNALRALGVRPREVTFLGYPDGGTALMWLRNWGARDLYRSSRTGDDHSPYENAFRRGAPYCGRAVLDDLEAVFRSFRPTVVALPHAADTHPDHWAAYCYGTAALYELGQLRTVRRLHYAVHEHGWPADPEASPGLGRWYELPLTAQEQARKREAIESFTSQLAVMGSFLRGLAKPVEAYAELPTESLPRREAARMQVDGATDDWQGVRPAILDPPKRDLPAGANIVSVRVGQDGQRLYLLIELRGAVAPGVVYDVHLHHLVKGRLEEAETRRVDPGRSPTRGASWRARGRFVEVALPAPAAGWEGAMLSVDTVRDRKLVDRTRSVMVLR